MNTPQLFGRLFDGSIDIVGDVHGEIDALRHLLEQLGYSQHGEHAQGRRLVFVGDLCDRGPDSPAVLQLVMALVQRGFAQCLLGNHEINLLREAPKSGNGWFFARNHDEAHGFFAHSRAIDPQQRAAVLQFLAGLPLLLQRDDLRIVHAAWIPESIQLIRKHSEADAVTLYQEYEQRIEQDVLASGLKKAVTEELRAYGAMRTHPYASMPYLPNLAEYDEIYQMGNPVRVLTSGVEQRSDHPYYVGGKWRMVRREPWWKSYSEAVPVVMGHYWRCVDAATQHLVNRGDRDLFAGHAPDDWLGPLRNVYCVDFSVGGRYKERDLGHHGAWGTRLAALRWPERELVFDEGQRLPLKPGG
jgi:Calcineurin-like phosphoesterase